MNDWKRKRQKLTHWPPSSVLCVFYSSRYWGEPFPIIYDEANPDVAIPLTEADLPLTLPEVESYEPTGTGESPLAAVEEWMRTETREGKPARRETNTMPQWAGSCWYVSLAWLLSPFNSDHNLSLSLSRSRSHHPLKRPNVRRKKAHQ